MSTITLELEEASHHAKAQERGGDMKAGGGYRRRLLIPSCCCFSRSQTTTAVCHQPPHLLVGAEGACDVARQHGSIIAWMWLDTPPTRWKPCGTTSNDTTCLGMGSDRTGTHDRRLEPTPMVSIRVMQGQRAHHRRRGRP